MRDESAPKQVVGTGLPLFHAHTRGAAQVFKERLNASPVHLVASGNEYRLRCLAQAGVGLGAGSRPPCSPAHYGAGGGFMLGLHHRPRLTQGEIAPCGSA